MAKTRTTIRAKRMDKKTSPEDVEEVPTFENGIEKLKAARAQKEKKSGSSSSSQSGSQSPEDDSMGEKNAEEEVDLSKLTKREFLNRGPLMFVVSAGMKEINTNKPGDPIVALAEYLMKHKDLHGNPDWKKVFPTDHYHLF